MKQEDSIETSSLTWTDFLLNWIIASAYLKVNFSISFVLLTK